MEPSSLEDRPEEGDGEGGFDPERSAFLDKLQRAEEDVALLRLAVVVVNGLAFLALGMQGEPMRTSAIAVLVAALLYAVGMVLLQAEVAFGGLSSSATTALLDTVAIGAWLATTGGWDSPYFMLWYASIAAVGYRYNLPITMAIGAVYTAAYGGIIHVTDGAIPWIEFGLRVAYIPLVGALVGLVSESYVEARHEHRRAQNQLVDALAELDRRFLSVLDDAPDRILITDPGGHVEYTNRDPADLGFARSGEDGYQARGAHTGAIRRALEDRTWVEYLAKPDHLPVAHPFWCRIGPIEHGDELVGALLIARAAPEDLDLASAKRRRKRSRKPTS